MKLYTLNYNCNVPTTQQINVPTNTDYKVGIKVTRNGKEQNLKPAEVKLYTGELSAIAPTEFDFGNKEVQSGSGVSFLLSYNETTQTDISALYNQPVKCTDIYVESSTDNGVTWAKTIASGPQYMKINDRSAGTNNYVAQKDLSDPDSKFELITGGYVTGAADEITLPSIVRFSGNFNTDYWQNTVRPCQMRLVIKYGGRTVSLYISPDAELTNGYMTFTRSTEDEAFGEADVIDIQHAQDAATLVSTYHNTTGAQKTLPAILSATVDESAVGKSMTPYDILVYVQTNLSAEPTSSEMAAASQPLATTTSPFLNMKTVMTGSKGALWSFTGATRNQYIQSFITEGVWKAEDGIPFFFVPTGSQNFSPLKEYTFDGSEVFTLGVSTKCQNDKYAAARVNIGFDQPFDAQFKLNTNVFKSQQGDKSDGVENANTATLTGEYSDGTEFNYNIVIA